MTLVLVQAYAERQVGIEKAVHMLLHSNIG